MTKKIICGDITDDFNYVPSKMFRKAMELSLQNSFEVRSNNPQFIEALEVLCGEENIEVEICINDEFQGRNYINVPVITAYNYLGDLYDIINRIRVRQMFDGEISLEEIEKDIKNYEKKYSLEKLQENE